VEGHTGHSQQSEYGAYQAPGQPGSPEIHNQRAAPGDPLHLGQDALVVVVGEVVEEKVGDAPVDRLAGKGECPRIRHYPQLGNRLAATVDEMAQFSVQTHHPDGDSVPSGTVDDGVRYLSGSGTEIEKGLLRRFGSHPGQERTIEGVASHEPAVDAVEIVQSSMGIGKR
jgi:hypothetical protein